jgi:hypothetical protein
MKTGKQKPRQAKPAGQVHGERALGGGRKLILSQQNAPGLRQEASRLLELSAAFKNLISFSVSS